MELYVLFLVVFSFQAGIISCANHASDTVGIDIAELIYRMGEYERRENDVLSKLELVLAENDQLNHRITNIEIENEKLRHELFGIRSNKQMNVDNSMDYVNSDNNNDLSGLHEQDQPIKLNVNHVRKERSVSAVPRIQRAENEANVAFYVTLGNHLQHEGANQNIAFENIITNVGNAYNSHSGDFRAPVAGTYVFSVSLMALSSHTTHYYIAKNGSGVGNLYVRGKESPYASSSATIVLRLNAGDDVAVRNVDPDEALHGSSYSMFSGFLLQQDFPAGGVVVG